jgi:hypothetical protein
MLLRDNAVIQERVAVAHARLASMTSWLSQSIQESWDGCVANGKHGFDDRVTMRLASTYAIREATKVAQDVYTRCRGYIDICHSPFRAALSRYSCCGPASSIDPAAFTNCGPVLLRHETEHSVYLNLNRA